MQSSVANLSLSECNSKLVAANLEIQFIKTFLSLSLALCCVFQFHSFLSLLTCFNRKFFLAFPSSSRVGDLTRTRCGRVLLTHNQQYFLGKTHPTSSRTVRPIIAAWDVG